MAPYEEVSVSGFEDFTRAVEQHKGKTIFAYFTGSKDAEGKSWCPDCVLGEAGVRGCCPKGVEEGKAEVLAGERSSWQRKESYSWRSAGLSKLAFCLLVPPCSLLSR